MINQADMPSDDHVLIRECVEGKRSAQRELYDRYARKMFGVCLRYSKDYHRAEDLLQEGFIKVFRNLGKFRGDGSFEGWLRRIFVNTAIEHFRKTTHLYPINEAIHHSANTITNGALENLGEKDLLAFIQRLSPGYRTVFNLYAIEGYSHKEVAEMLGISEGTSKSQLARARYILQKAVIKHQQVTYETVAQGT
jgi:RNA polymerase sigma-70 factor (ECF subfamily)